MAKIISTSETMSPRRFRMTRLRVFIGIIILAFVATAVVLFVPGFNKKASVPQEDPVRKEITQLSIDAASATSSQDSIISKTDILARYDEVLKKVDDTSSKINILINKTTYALNTKNYAVAEQAALEAYKLSKTYQTANVLGMVYEAKNDIPQAIKYYQESLNLMPKDTDSSADLNEIKSRILQLQEASR